MKSWVVLQPLADHLCFEILSVIEKKDDGGSLAVRCRDHLKVLDSALSVAVFFSRYMNESMGVWIVSSQNIEPLPPVFVLRIGGALGSAQHSCGTF